MRRASGLPFVAVVLAAIACAGCGRSHERTATTTAASHATDNNAPRGTLATVAFVVDGDTLRTTRDERVRLVQIDAPETHDPVQCFGRDAATHLQQLLPRGTRVRLDDDPTLDDHDVHGRLLRYVWTESGTLVNVQLVRDGAALPYFYRNERGAHARELLHAADDARRDRRGMWGRCPDVHLNTGIGL